MKIYQLTLADAAEIVAGFNPTAQAIQCPSCGGPHAIQDCEIDREEQEFNDVDDYFGFNRPLRFDNH